MKNLPFNSLLNVKPEKWAEHGINLLAFSSGGTLLVNSFIARWKGRRYYGFRKHEFKDGRFTGEQWFEVEAA